MFTRYDHKNFLYLFFALFLVLPFGVSAIEISRLPGVPIQNDIVLSPAKVELALDPGQRSTQYINVINRLGQDAVFTVDIQDFAPSEDLRAGVILNKTISEVDSSLKKYISVDTLSFMLSQGERARIAVVVDIPKGVMSGGRYAAVLISGTPATNTLGATKVITQLGTLFFVKINGNVQKSGSLRGAIIRDGKFELTFENSGDIYLAPYGIINVRRVGGAQISSIRMDPWFVLPRSTRIYTVPAGDLQPGKYVAEISVNRGYDDIVDSGEITFKVGSSSDNRFGPVWSILLIAIMFGVLYKIYLWKE